MASFADVVQSSSQSTDTPDNPAAGYVLALAGAVIAVAVAAAARRWVGLQDLSLVFMLAVLIVAVHTRTGPALATAVLCFLGYNFFFFEPHYTFSIASRQGVATVALFLAAAMLAGRLASRLAMQVTALRRAHDHALARQRLSERLAEVASEDLAIQATAEILRRTLDAEVWIRLGDRDQQPREGVEEHGWWFVPLRGLEQPLGTIGLKLPAHRRPLDTTQRALVQAIGDELAQTLLRLRLLAELQAERLAGETERLRNALLSSVSHDLRTPLASIIGAAGSLESYAGAMSEQDRRDLLETIRLEGERLDRYIQNLLDMTRIEHGDLVLERDWTDAEDLIAAAVARLHRQHPRMRIEWMLDSDLGALWVQASLLEQALFNVIDNAARYSPPDEPITIAARRGADGQLRIDVSDRGPGIPAHEQEKVFDLFYRVERGDRGRDRGGTGLGLAISRGMVMAHRGTIAALPRDRGAGTTIRITLPHAEPPKENA